MKQEFKIIISSDTEYEELCAEIYFEDQFVAILTQEDGLENLKIEIHLSKNLKPWFFSFAEFEDILNKAKQYLKEMNKNI